jgi:hypothetical protein
MIKHLRISVLKFLIICLLLSGSGWKWLKGESTVLYGIDVLKSLHFEPLEWKRAAVFCNQSSLDTGGTHLLDMLHASDIPRIPLIYIFDAPEWEGMTKPDELIWHDSTRIRQLSYPLLRFQTLDLLSCDAIVFDMQLSGTLDDPGVSLLQIATSLATRHDLELIVCDRPPMTRADTCQGPWHPGFELPYQYGLTSGELAAYFGRYFFPGLRLSVIPLQNWQRHHTASYNKHYPVCPDTLIHDPGQSKYLVSLSLLKATNLYFETDKNNLWFGSPSADPFFIKAKLSDIDPAFGNIQIKTARVDTLPFQVLSLDHVPLPDFYRSTAALRLMLILYPQQVFINTDKLLQQTGSEAYGQMLLEHKPLEHFKVYWDPGYRTFFERREQILLYPAKRRPGN